MMEEDTSDGENALKNTTERHLAMRRVFNKGGNTCDGNNSGEDESEKDEDSDHAESNKGRAHDERENPELLQAGTVAKEDDINGVYNEETLVSNDDSAAVDGAAQVSLCFCFMKGKRFSFC
jgi:hypothetical protein